MQNLPTAEVYEKEFQYLPWRDLIKRVKNIVVKEASRDGSVLDLLCGPGYLLGQLQQERPDLSFVGVDADVEYIVHAEQNYPGVTFVVHDVMTWQSTTKYDVVLCTGGLHHLPYEQQEHFLQKIARLVLPGGFALIGDPYIDDFSTEVERKISAAKLGHEYIIATINNGATEDVITSTIDILRNDVLRIEFKTSLNKMLPMMRRVFSDVHVEKIWPKENTHYGDYLIILKR